MYSCSSLSGSRLSTYSWPMCSGSCSCLFLPAWCLHLPRIAYPLLWLAVFRMLKEVKSCTHIAACCALLAVTMAGGLSADSVQSPYQLPSNSQVIGYLLQSVNWYRHAYTERQVANESADLIFLDDIEPLERQIVKLSFEFAKADAMLQASTASPHGRPAFSNPPPADLAHFIEFKNRNDRLSLQAIEE